MRTWVKEARLAKSLTQGQVAGAAGISESYFCQIETGQRTPRPETAKSIATVIGVDWTRFYEEVA